MADADGVVVVPRWRVETVVAAGEDALADRAGRGRGWVGSVDVVEVDPGHPTGPRIADSGPVAL